MQVPPGCDVVGVDWFVPLPAPIKPVQVPFVTFAAKSTFAVPKFSSMVAVMAPPLSPTVNFSDVPSVHG